MKFEKVNRLRRPKLATLDCEGVVVCAVVVVVGLCVGVAVVTVVVEVLTPRALTVSVWEV